MPDQLGVLVMVPLRQAQLAQLSQQLVLDGPWLAISPTATLAGTFGLDDGEDVEAAALQLADVAGLANQPGILGPTGSEPVFVRRLVVVASVPPDDVTSVADQAANGVVRLAKLATADIISIFTGECDQVVAKAAAEQDLDQAWELPEIQAMLANAPLSWHDRSELLELCQL